MDVGAYIIKPLASITLGDLNRPRVNASSGEHNPCDSSWETASITTPSIMSEDSCDTSETMRCDGPGRSPSPFPFEPNNTIIRLSCVDSERSSTIPAEFKSSESSKLQSCEIFEQSAIACTETSKLPGKSLLVFAETKLTTSEWPKSRVLTIEQLNSKRQPGPQQCSFCGKYEKPSKRHLRCGLCGYATYCREKCQARDRNRHYKYDCLIRQTTPWFSIKRNKYDFTELCAAKA